MTTTMAPRQSGRFAAPTAVTGTVLIAAGAFWLSFVALADLASRSGIDAGQAWAWPLIVDGIIVVATVAVVALAGTRSAWYPWLLLMFGAGLSVTANSIHAVVAADADVPSLLAAAVAAVPPLVLLAITHLTVILTRHQAHPAPKSARECLPQPSAKAFVFSTATKLGGETPTVKLVDSEPRTVPSSGPISTSAAESLRVPGQEGRAVAGVLREAGWSNKKIARHLRVDPSTVGRWHPQTSPLHEGEPLMSHAEGVSDSMEQETP